LCKTDEIPVNTCRYPKNRVYPRRYCTQERRGVTVDDRLAVNGHILRGNVHNVRRHGIDQDKLVRFGDGIDKGFGEAQAAFPGQVLANVFSIMGNAEDVLYLISYMVVIIGFLTIITLHWSVLNRKHDHATLRALGANKRVIFLLILIESFMVMLSIGTR
jgi:hypothetical protein